jgi:hypothetical protein
MVNITWRTAYPIEDFTECAGTTPTFLIPVQNNKMQLASNLYSALFNYSPLVIGGTDKNKQLTIKPTQTGIKGRDQ